MELVVGQALTSSVDATAVIVTRAPEGEAVLACGGVPMVPTGAAAADGAVDPGLQGGTLLGKRYVDEAERIEVLVTKGGEGTLTLDGAPLAVLGAKPLPASD